MALARGLVRPASSPGPHFLPQTLKTLRQVEVINFGDCLVRSKGAVAIADAVRGGLPKLKVLQGRGFPARSGGGRGSGTWVWVLLPPPWCQCLLPFGPQFL